jgi:Uncharacterized conserved protein
MSPGECLRCKGLKLLCGKAQCPLLTQYRVRAGVNKMLSKDICDASPPGIFVGWKGYPKVQMGPMVSIGEYDLCYMTKVRTTLMLEETTLEKLRQEGKGNISALANKILKKSYSVGQKVYLVS